MSNNHNFLALDWVKSEIEETLKQAQQSLEAHVANESDSSQLRFCLAYLHQIFGTLQMVEFHGAAMLAEEMEKLCLALVNGKCRNNKAAYDALVKAMLQLPAYLERLQVSKRDTPFVLLPAINELRVAHEEAPLSEIALFQPDFSRVFSIAAQGGSTPTAENLKKLRHLYQLGLLGVFRQQNVREGLDTLHQALGLLGTLLGQKSLQALWQISEALIEGLINKSIPLTPAVKQLLGDIEHEIRKFAGYPQHNPSLELLKNILYYIAKSQGTSPTIAAIRALYRLDEALPSQEKVEAEKDKLNAPNRDALKSVIANIDAELVSVKEAIDDLMYAERPSVQTLEPLLPMLRQMSSTLMVMGWSHLQRIVDEQLVVMSGAIRNDEVAEGTLLHIAAGLLEVESGLQQMIDDSSSGENYTGSGTVADQLSTAQAAVLRESRTALEKSKEVIVEYISSQWDPLRLTELPQLLKTVRGGLTMLDLVRPSQILGKLTDFVEQHLLREAYRPTWSEMDTMADIVSSVEYYLERMANHHQNNDLLEMAEKALDKLGYGLVFASPAVQFPIQPYHDMMETRKESEQDQSPASEMQEVGDTQQTLLNIPALVLPEIPEDMHLSNETAVNLPVAIIEDDAFIDHDDISGKTLVGMPALVLPEETVQEEPSLSMDSTLTEIPALEIESLTEPSQEFAEKTLLSIPVITDDMLKGNVGDPDRTLINMPALNIPLMEEAPQIDAAEKTLLSIPVVDIPLAESASEQTFSSFNDFDSTVSFDAEALLGDMTFTLRPSTAAAQSASPEQVEEKVLSPEPDFAAESSQPERIDAADVVVADVEEVEEKEANQAQTEDLMVDADETIGYQSDEASISLGSDTSKSMPVARPVRPNFAAMPEDDFDQDDEIREIFIEEATEVMETIHEFFPKWASNFENKNALTEFRRGFHTLKGSGRMVGARVVGELAWSIENMLNRVIDKTATANGVMVNLISAVLEVIPGLVENYNQRALPSIHTVPLMEIANRFGKGESPTETELAEAIAWSSQTVSEIEPEPVQEPEVQISSTEVLTDTSSTVMGAEELQGFDSEFAEDEVFELEDVVGEAEQVPGPVGQAEADETVLANQQASESQNEQSQLPDASTIEVGTVRQDAAAVSKITVLNHMPQDDFSQDDEIREIFIEEAEEVMETIHEFFPKWAANFNNKSALTEFRRGFHTLKGSGRMVGGKVVGELAWSIENMLNRVIDHTATPNEAMTRLITEVLGLIPELVTAFQNRETPAIDTGPMMTVADEFSRANPVTVERVLDALNQARHLTSSSEVVQVDAVESETPSDSDVSSLAVVASNDQAVSVHAQQSDTVEQDHTDAFEALASSLEQVNPEDSDSDTGADPVLMEIFVCEANTYLEEIEQFLQGVSQGARMVVTDEVLRALHTLRGSSGMAGVKTVAGIAAPMESLFKDLRNQGRMLNAAHIELLGETHRLIKQSINSVAGGGQGLVSGDDLLLERIEQVSRTPAEAHEETYEVDQTANTAGIVAGFLDLGLDHLLDAPWELSGWLNGDDRDEHIATMLGELHQLHPEAVKAKIEPLSQLVAGLTGVYRQISRDPQSSLANEALMEALANAHDELINIFDTLAACQTVGANDELIQKLADWSAVAVEPAEQPVRPVAEIDNGADAELLSIFLEEGEEVLQAADDEFQSWKQDPDNKQALRALQRHLHTLKGGARMAVVASLGDLAHELEFLYEGLLDGRYQPTPILTDLLLRCHDRIAGQLSDLMATGRCEYAKDLVEVINQYRHTPKDTVILDFFSSAAGGSTEAPSIQPAAEPELQVAVAEDSSLSPAVATFVQPEVEQETPTAPAEGPTSGFDAEMLEIFLEEAQEIVEETNSKLAEWQTNPSDTGPVKILQRGLHTLKGGARMSGVTALGDLAHEMENLYEGACLNRYQGTPAVFSILQRCHDRIAEAVDMLQASGQCPGVSDLVNALKRYLSNPAIFSDDRSEAASVKLPAAPVIPAVVEAAVEVATVAASAPMMDEVGIPSMLGNFRNLKAQQTAQEMIRVSSELMEKLINLAGEGSIIRSRVEMGVHGFAQTVEEMGATVQRLADQLRRMQGELESQIIAQHTTEGGKYEDFDPLEMDQYSSVNQLSKSLYESASDLMDIKGTLIEKARDTETLLLQQARLNTELQEGLMSSRMVPFSRLAPRLQRIVRQTSQEVHKPAELIVINAEGEMDRTLLERLVAPLEHMLRNSVDHGMEPPEDRARSGKDMMGRITLTLSREGGEVVLTLADDGRGINVEAVRNKAIERGLLSADAEVSEREVLQLIFHAGLSTAQKVTQVSGRGVGMDVVVSEIKQLGGAIAIASAQGKGTTFTLRLPFTVAVSRALMVRIGEDVYAIPLSQIEGIVRASPYELETYYAPEAPPFEYAGITYKLHYLGEFVHGLRTPSLFGQTLPLPILLVRGGEQRVAIQVDQLIGSREIVVKSVGAQLASVAGISGATILGDGSVVIILDVQAMLRAAAISKPRQKSDVEKARVVPEKATRTVMVVDDSVTVRKVTSRLLERHGYEVVLAKDGLDAITKLEDIRPDIMLLDIEMPRMDGFEVASLVRHNPNLVGLPIIMITSRTGEKHRERAFQIGVNCYMGKPFQEQQLLDTIGELLATAVER